MAIYKSRRKDANEKELLDSVERGEWKSAGGGKRERSRYTRYAKAFRKDRRLNIRLSSKDLEAIQKRALAEGLPYQTLISSRWGAGKQCEEAAPIAFGVEDAAHHGPDSCSTLRR